MAKFMFIFTFLLCASASLAEGDSDPSSITDTIWLLLTETSPSATCTTTCPTSCAAEDAACVDVPSVTDCDALSTQCAGACDAMCSCYKACTTKCINIESCDGVPTDEIIPCNLRHHMCVVDCNAHCPVEGITREFTALTQGYTDKVMKLANALKSMLPGAAGGAGGAERR